MWIHGIRDKTFPLPIPQPNEKLKTGSLTKNRAADEGLTNVQTASSAALKSIFRFLLFLRLLHSHRSGFIPYSVKVASNWKFFCNSVLKLPQIGSINKAKKRREGGRNPDHREALLACSYHICRSRVRQGCAAKMWAGESVHYSLNATKHIC